ncbi:PIG-L deacetylase family protein [Deinococcus roseus]|uniref:PIG-L family deacetylase n=1 Tax=Deinococcus roseus TaxID=392414 RepID=A0ABQ2CXE2_9DEIO|nr:PIG-L family deacetylase [Deinococcus roseus]GGJ30539.1 PIG-L family deacetylase [Deinococcus roseus]
MKGKFKIRLQRDRWNPLNTLIFVLIFCLFLAAGINGWGFLFTGKWVVAGVEHAAKQLPDHAPVRGKVLILSPHPDDETLAAGGLIQDVLQHDGDVVVIFLTNGDGFPWDARYSSGKLMVNASVYLKLGRERQNEATLATNTLGVPARNVYFLGFPDRGLRSVYLTNYLIPFKSRYTQVDHVPYANAYKPGSPYTGQELEKQVLAIARKFNPDVIMAPTPLDQHPDHQATSYMSSRVLSELPHTKILYYLVHGGVEWPLPKGYHPDLPLSPPAETIQGIEWQKYPLTSAQQKQKYRAMLFYKSQVQILGRFMQAFSRENELVLPPVMDVHNDRTNP